MLLRFQTVTFLLAVISTANGLQASDIPTDTPVSSLVSTAKSHLAQGAAQDALLYFNAAVSKDPSNYLTVFQRGATYLSLGKQSKATEDFDLVLQLKPGFEGALVQRGKLRTKNGNWEAAKQDFTAAGKKGETELEELEEARKAALAAEDAEKNKDWETCVSQAGVAILKASTTPALRHLRAKCRFERGEVREGINDLSRVLHLSPGLVQPHLQISAMLFYSLADERGVAQIRKCLHSDPDSKPCSRMFRREKKITKQIKTIDQFWEKRKFSKIVGLLIGTSDESGLLEDVRKDVETAQADGFIHKNSPNQLYADLVEKACALYRTMNSKRKGKPYCEESLQLDSTSLHGLLYKAESQVDSEEYEAAINTLNSANEHHPDLNEVRTLLHKAQTLLKRSKQKDYYKVLGVDREADGPTIKRAYRQLTKIHHPDKSKSQGISKEDAEKKMASINEAYEVLSDPELRARFDGGDDPNDPHGQSRGGSQGSPFGGGGGGGGRHFFFQQGGGGSNAKFQHQFNFPGGFPFG